MISFDGPVKIFTAPKPRCPVHGSYMRRTKKGAYVCGNRSCRQRKNEADLGWELIGEAEVPDLRLGVKL